MPSRNSGELGHRIAQMSHHRRSEGQEMFFKRVNAPDLLTSCEIIDLCVPSASARLARGRHRRLALACGGMVSVVQPFPFSVGAGRPLQRRGGVGGRSVGESPLLESDTIGSNRRDRKARGDLCRRPRLAICRAPLAGGREWAPARARKRQPWTGLSLRSPLSPRFHLFLTSYCRRIACSVKLSSFSGRLYSTLSSARRV